MRVQKQGGMTVSLSARVSTVGKEARLSFGGKGCRRTSEVPKGDQWHSSDGAGEEGGRVDTWATALAAHRRTLPESACRAVHVHTAAAILLAANGCQGSTKALRVVGKLYETGICR